MLLRIIGPLQTVHRAEHWDVILVLQAYSGIHIGIDNLNVLRGVAKITDNGITDTPLPLINDGDCSQPSILCYGFGETTR